jgi:hypothetical protein
MTDIRIADHGKGLELLIRRDLGDMRIPITDEELELLIYRGKAALAARQKIILREWR